MKRLTLIKDSSKKREQTCGKRVKMIEKRSPLQTPGHNCLILKSFPVNPLTHVSEQSTPAFCEL